MSSFEVVMSSFLSSFVGVVILFFRSNNTSLKGQTIVLGFAGGMMLAASFFSLLLPGLESLELGSGGTHSIEKLLLLVFCFCGGAVLMDLLHGVIPHLHSHPRSHVAKYAPKSSPQKTMAVRRALMISSAMAMHNIPEGMALGVGALQQDPSLVNGLVLGIASQNIPEGALMALSLKASGASRWQSVFGVFLSAVAESLCCLLAFYFGFGMTHIIPWALVLCSGAMIYVVSQEMIPETHASGYERLATYSLFVGLTVYLIVFVQSA